MRGTRCIWLWLFLAALAAMPAFGAEVAPKLWLQDLTVRSWGKEEGLPDDSVTAVLQARDGYLWVGTLRGLARFDGVRFCLFSPTEAKSQEPMRVTALCEDAAGRLWIGTQDDGLFWYAGGVVNRFKAGRLSDRTINSIAEDTAGNLWIGTPLGLDRLKDAKLVHFTSKDGLPSDFVSGVHAARSGTVWITTRGGICLYRDGKVSRFPIETERLGRSPGFIGVYEDRQGNPWSYGDTYLVNLVTGKGVNYFGSGGRIWSLCEGRNGQLWVGTSSQWLIYYAGDEFLMLSLRASRPFGDVRALCEDREGNLWLGTYSAGLGRLQPRSVRLLGGSPGLPGDSATCVALDAGGQLWAGFQHAGLYAGTSDHLDRSAASGSIGAQNLISSICTASDSSLWVGTLGVGLYCVKGQRVSHYRTADGLVDDIILALAAGADGAVWAATQSGSLHRFSNGGLTSFGKEAGLTGQAISAILPAHDGSLWLGTEGGEVLHSQRDRFQRLGGTAALAGKAVRALYQSSSGRLWVGTAGGVLACLTDGRWASWDARQGRADDAILAILDDEAGDLWLETNRGIYRIVASELKGLLSGQSPLRTELLLEIESAGKGPVEYGWPRGVRARDGRLWFAAGNSVATIFDPRELAPSAPPPVYIEEIQVNGQLLAQPLAPAPVRLPSDMRSLEIQFTALSFAAPEKIRFQHKLDNFDVDWMDARADRRVHYGRLPPGTYNFRVKACNAAGIWNDAGAGFTFLIQPPVWRSWWALSLYGMSAAGTVAGLAAALVQFVSYRRLRSRLSRLAQAEAMQRERMRIAQDMHDEIGSKLTKISFMSERAKGELAGQAPVAAKLDSIAHTSRDLLQTLDEIVWAVNPHNDTLEHLAAYLGQYATEYLQNTAVECELHIPRGLPHHPLSAEARHNVFLAFEEALNNALKHAGASRVRIDMVAEPARFEITIQDNGCGFDPAAAARSCGGEAAALRKRGGNGLWNMQKRLADAGGQCSIRSELGQGTRVTLSVPLAAEDRNIS